MSGPRMLNTVRMPISLLTGATKRMDWWYLWANMNANPHSPRILSESSGDRSILAPSASRTSAAPQRLLAARLPCLATGTPQAATTNAEVVEMLNEPERSPPVPTISSASEWSPGSISPCSLISAADAAISSTVSPFSASAVRYDDIMTSEHSPLIIESMTERASS